MSASRLRIPLLSLYANGREALTTVAARPATPAGRGGRPGLETRARGGSELARYEKTASAHGASPVLNGVTA